MSGLLGKLASCQILYEYINKELSLKTPYNLKKKKKKK